MDLSEVLPALLFPFFFIGASAVVYQSFKLRHLKMEVVNRFKALKQEKSMDHHMLSPKYAWLTYRPIPLSHYRTSDLILNRLILKIERWGWFKLTLGRLILFGAISLVVTSISTLTTSLLLLIIPVSYLIILGNDIWNIHRYSSLENKQKILHIIISLITGFVYSGVIRYLFQNPHGILTIKSKIRAVEESAAQN